MKGVTLMAAVGGVALAFLSSLLAPAAGGAVAETRPAVAALLEDNADTLLPQLTDADGNSGESRVETAEVFSGKSAVRIVPLQRFRSHLPGWNYRIVEKPSPGEYRYVRWAWKADGCAGTMVQFHIASGWSVRYCAGNNDPGWGAKQLAQDPPRHWVVVTRDLFADFGECTVTGIALAAFRGKAAYFDHVYFGRTLDDLDRVDATGLRNGPPPGLGPGAMGRLWADLGDEDQSRSYLAFWTLAAVPGQTVPFLSEVLSAQPSPTEAAAQVTRWNADLDAPDVMVRERATSRLSDHPEAVEALRRAHPDAGPEARTRIDHLLQLAAENTRDTARIAKGIRILRYVNTPQAVALLKDLAMADPASAVTVEARRALDSTCTR